MLFKLAIVVATVEAQQFWTPKHGKGKNTETTLHAVSDSNLQFDLGGVQVTAEVNGEVSLQVPGWSYLNEPGEPELPVLRASMALPSGFTGAPRVIVSDVRKEQIPLSAWGASIKHSPGKCSICHGCNSSVVRAETAYSRVFPQIDVVTLEEVHVWRDIKGVVVEVQPISVDHAAGTVTIVHSASIKLVGVQGSAKSEPVVVDPAFLDAYKFVYSNWQHVADGYTAAPENGRVLVVYDQQFHAQAQTYADIVKQRLGSEIIMYKADASASAIKQIITGHYKESAGLSYVTIIGRDVDAPIGSNTYKECDNCYGMMSGGVNVDLFIGRIGGSASEIETYLNKLKNYDSSSTEAWNKKAYGTAFNLAGDEYGTMTSIMGSLSDADFTSHGWDRDSTASGPKSMSQMNSGIGVFSYIGHGSGTAWNTPSISEYDLASLTNKEMPFFEIDVSCDNGGFRGKRCMGEALITTEGAAIATMMHAPEARGTMCKKYQEQAAKAIAAGAASKVGPVYITGLMKAQQLDKDDYAVQAYNIFGDPTLHLAFAKGTAPAPTPTPTPAPPPTPTPGPPTPVPTPTPTPGACHAISALVDDNWCVENCGAGFCPSDLCECDSILV